MTDGPPFVRLAGRGRGPDGALVTWTVAEGRRGRRWRETAVRDDGMLYVLLYETDVEGRFTHLELAAPTGLATLHPEGDGTLHGNVVRPGSGVEHLVGMPFAAVAVLLVRGSSVTSAAAARAGQRSGDASLPAVVLDPVTLTLRSETLERSTLGQIDERGIPVMDDARVWPLEAD